MRDTQKELDIAKHIKLIEWLKTELLDNVSALFRGFQQGRDLLLKEALANLIILSYLLARRLGMRYSQLDELILEKIRLGAGPHHDSDMWRSDLQTLENYFRNKK